MTPSEYVAFDTHVMRAQRNLDDATDAYASAERQANRSAIVAATSMMLGAVLVFSVFSAWAMVVACVFSASAIRRFWKATTEADTVGETIPRLREALWAERYAAVSRWQSESMQARESARATGI
jgi:hypothetical protein